MLYRIEFVLAYPTCLGSALIFKLGELTLFHMRALSTCRWKLYRI